MSTVPTGQTRIFLVEDHPLMRRAYRYLLEEKPQFTICGETGRGEEALDKLAKADPDVVILDISLGETSGLVLARALKTQRPDLPVLVISMHERSHYVEAAREAGADGYIPKPRAVDELPEALQAILCGQSYF